MLVHQWESIRGFVIPIYVVELHVPSQLQKVVESLDSLQKAKEKKTVQFTSPCEPTLDPSLTEARMWADNLIVTQSSVYIDLNAAAQVQPMLKGTPHALKKPSTSWRQKLQIRRPIPRAAKDKPNASPSPSSLQPSSKQANTVPEPVNSPRSPLTRSQSSPSTKSAVPITPSSSQPSEGPKPISVEKRQAQPSSVATGRRTKSRSQPLNPTQVDLDDFHDFDVLDLGQPQIRQLDAFGSDVDENVENENNDFNVDEQEEFAEVSLDDKSNDNEVLDELDLELDTEQRMRLGHVHTYGSQGHVIVSKMAKRIHASVLVDKSTWMMRRHSGKHICGRTDSNKSASSRWVASNLLSYYRANSNATVKNMEDFIMTNYGVKVPKHTLWRAKKLMKIQGIIKALKNVMPQASRRICVLHVYKNFAAHYPGAWFHCFFYIAANAYSSFVHLKAMDKIKQKEPAAYQWLRDNEPLEHWARFKFDANLKSADDTNNFVESFNNAISKLRGKPMLTMLEEIRKLVGAKFDKRFQNASCWEGQVTPFVEKKLRLVEQDARNCLRVVHTGQGEFDVVEGCTNFTVKLKEHFCNCKKWQITGLPCKRSARCILRMKGQLEDYCAPWFSTDNYRKLYENIIHPLSDPCMWEDINLPTLDLVVELRKRGRLEKHNRRESASWAPVPQPDGQATRHFSGTKRDESGRLLEKYKKKRKTSTKPVRRPRKTLCTTGTSAGTSDPTSTATEAPPNPI
ncbi:hypothetical protein Cgig2_015878 [Carnegiea gigantea]|uniref:SWIM-type domain-containing protein n=1 Tax=Carnegiea gigantea TaxID=171969 RepID=A0A9Q1GTX8_9CARY|nr:hypothetical protein Cgig2_015878 [Carnegiea gigantea]